MCSFLKFAKLKRPESSIFASSGPSFQRSRSETFPERCPKAAGPQHHLTGLAGRMFRRGNNRGSPPGHPGKSRAWSDQNGVLLETEGMTLENWWFQFFYIARNPEAEGFPAVLPRSMDIIGEQGSSRCRQLDSWDLFNHRSNPLRSISTKRSIFIFNHWSLINQLVNIQSLITNPSVGEPFLFRGNRRLVLPLARRPEIGEVHASKAMDVLGFRHCWEF